MRPPFLCLLLVAFAATGCKPTQTPLPAAQEQLVSSLLESIGDLESHGGDLDPKSAALLASDLRVLAENLVSLRATAMSRESGLSSEEERFLATVAATMAASIHPNGDLSSVLRNTIDEGQRIAERLGVPWITGMEPGLWSATSASASIRVTIRGVHLAESSHLDALNVSCTAAEASDHALAFDCPSDVFRGTPVSTVTGNWARIPVRLTVPVRGSAWLRATEPRIFNLQATRTPDYAGRATITVSEPSSEEERQMRDQTMTITGSACKELERRWNIRAQDGWSIVADSIQTSSLREAGTILQVKVIQASVTDIGPNQFVVLIRAPGMRCGKQLFGRRIPDFRFSETAHVRWSETRRAIVAREIARDELIAWEEERAFALPEELTSLTLTFQRSDGSIGTWDGITELPPDEWFEVKRAEGDAGTKSLRIKAKSLSAVLSDH